MAFHDVRFPFDLAFGASGGPERKVDIVRLSGGQELRNASTARSRRRYDAQLGVTSPEQGRQLIDFFEARGGALHSFRFRDPVDHRAENELIGVGDGSQTQFRLTKGDRTITKPDIESVRVTVDGASVSVSIDALTGWVSLTNAPDIGAEITADFEFDIPVRFDTDRLSVSLETAGAVSITSVPLVEVIDA